MTSLLAVYALLFVIVGIGFILIHLLLGKLIRPSKPDAEKGTVYECGEPTIGSAWIQFDLRFYVVALLFVIFDVEVAFFFPWAEVFGKANALANAPRPDITANNTPRPDKVERTREYARKVLDLAPPHLDQRSLERYHQLATLEDNDADNATRTAILNRAYRDNRDTAWGLAWMALVEILVFFGVLLVGFAYLWKRGDLNWVRSIAAEEQGREPPPPPAPPAPVSPPKPELVQAGH
jgi:NADH-quinone oxidoreductase subunit A